MNIAHNLEASAYAFPDRPAVSEGRLEISYKELNKKANCVATSLINMGIKPGDHIAISYPNSTDWIYIYFGILKTGAVAVTLGATLMGDELIHLINHAKAKVVFVDAPKLKTLKSLRKSGVIDKIICAGGDTDLQTLITKGSSSFKAIDRERTATALILYTGGTTGIPKGVMVSHEHVSFSASSLAYSERSNQYDRALCFLPFNHIFGQFHIMNSTIFSAGCIEMLTDFNLENTLKLLEKGKITKFFSVPTIYIRLLAVPDLKKRLGKLRYCFSAGASIAKETVKQWEKTTGLAIAESYGMTEGMPFTYNHYYPEKYVSGSVGQPVPFVEIQIRDSSGNILKQGHKGEICARGRNVMKGYFDAPEATKAAFWENGWLRTGDIGFLDENGYVYIVDRLKDIIITGGENVCPREIEELLYTLPEIQECAVLGVPDLEWGEKVSAFIVPKSKKTIVSDDINAFLKKRLSPFKIPKQYLVVDALPRSPMGKIIKREIKRQYMEGPGSLYENKDFPANSGKAKIQQQKQ